MQDVRDDNLLQLHMLVLNHAFQTVELEFHGLVAGISVDLAQILFVYPLMMVETVCVWGI
jgi:hypothetical protein